MLKVVPAADVVEVADLHGLLHPQVLQRNNLALEVGSRGHSFPVLMHCCLIMKCLVLGRVVEWLLQVSLSLQQREYKIMTYNSASFDERLFLGTDDAIGM